MESRPQNPIFRINPENFHPCISLSDFDCEHQELGCIKN